MVKISQELIEIRECTICGGKSEKEAYRNYRDLKNEGECDDCNETYCENCDKQYEYEFIEGHFKRTLGLCDGCFDKRKEEK